MSVTTGHHPWQPPRESRRRGENTALALIIVVALIAFLWFGLQPGQAHSRIPTITPGVTFDAYPIRVTFGQAVALDEGAPPLIEARKGKRVLTVPVTITVIGDRYLLGWNIGDMLMLTAPGLYDREGEPSQGNPVGASPYRSEGMSFGSLQPGVTTELILAWPQDLSAEVPQTLQIQIFTLEWAESTLQDRMSWRVEDVVARTDLPVGGS